MIIKLKRIYDKSSSKDGFRIFVDRLWARGLTKEKADLDLWSKDIAPSNELRKWYSHDPDKWIIFCKKYISELKKNKSMVEQLIKICRKHKVVTFVYASKSKLNNAQVLLNYIKKLI